MWRAEREAAVLVCARLREQGLATVLDCDGGNLKKAMARANKCVRAPCCSAARARRLRVDVTRCRRCSTVCVIVGEDELARGQATVRCMQVGGARG